MISRSCFSLTSIAVALVILPATVLRADQAKPAPPARLLPPDRTVEQIRKYLHSKLPRFERPIHAASWVPSSERLRHRVLDEVVFRGTPMAWRNAPLNIVWGDKLPANGYVIRKLRYEAVPGLWIGALLYEPTKLEGKVPAILNVNGHVGAPGMTIEYEQVRCINLAKRGMLALHPEWFGMGELSAKGYDHSEQAWLDLCGCSGVSVFYLALSRSLDVLCSQPSTDRERIAVTGLSGGGWQTIFISALDTRVSLCAPNAGYIGLAARIDNMADIGDLEQNPVDLVSVADYLQLTAMLAPRPALLIYNRKDDCCFPADRARASVYDPIVPVYKMMKRPDAFDLHVNEDPGTHNYLKDNRVAFYKFVNKHLLPDGKGQDDEIPVDSEIRKQEELKIDYPADNASFHTLARNAMTSLPRRAIPTGESADLELWRDGTRPMLHQLVRVEPAPALKVESLDVTTRPAAPAGAQADAMLLHLHNQWTMPAVMYTASGTPASSDITLVLADAGRESVMEIIRKETVAGRRVLAIDILFTGECLPDSAWQYAEMISTVGRRPLGIQVAQLHAVVQWIRQSATTNDLRIIAQGRAASLAALVTTALDPEPVKQLELRGLEASLKELLPKGAGYGAQPTLFCFGLLELVDVPEMIEMARPAQVTRTAGG